MTAFKSLLFFILVPGLLLGYVPFYIASTNVSLFDFGVFRYLALLFWLAGAAGMVWCFLDFLVKGRGTPAPIDPPKELVISGLYRYVRNPMYVSGLIALFGWLTWSPSRALILASLLFFVAAHLFVMLYEEPHLRKTFGAAYEEYCKSVPRWIPRLR
ncbi:MAG: isoprenylcysteine carboxylmethyltransferase family protein [Chloroflexi bacterium]|nr:isoprenylcysteine carboxylmethyltransferase family protein [Chloroflexota bacterium]